MGWGSEREEIRDWLMEGVVCESQRMSEVSENVRSRTKVNRLLNGEIFAWSQRSLC